MASNGVRLSGRPFFKGPLQPLSRLGNAIEDLAEDSAATPVPSSSFSEVERLSVLFGAMRERLLLRTAERERAFRGAHARCAGGCTRR